MGKLKAHQAVAIAIQMLDDTRQESSFSERVCDVAANALEEIGTSEALQAVAEWRKSQA